MITWHARLYPAGLTMAGTCSPPNEIPNQSLISSLLLVLWLQAPGAEPVWRQLLRLHINHRNIQVAQQAHAALED